MHMHTVPECLPCLLRQALQTARFATTDEALQLEILRAAAAHVARADTTPPPAVFSQPVYEAVARITGCHDVYASLKQATNRLALELLPEVRARVLQSTDPLAAALHAAAAGNVIDAGVNHGFDVHRDMEALLATPFAIDDLDALRARLRPGARLLYLADNAGEIVFDGLAIELLQAAGADVTLVVKSHPIINDAMRADAAMAGLEGRVPILETGSGDVGVNWAHAAPALRRAFDAADLVLAKGHGHFETLAGEPHPGLFLLLKAKCPVVADTAGCRLGDLVLIHGRRLA